MCHLKCTCVNVLTVPYCPGDGSLVGGPHHSKISFSSRKGKRVNYLCLNLDVRVTLSFHSGNPEPLDKWSWQNSVFLVRNSFSPTHRRTSKFIHGSFYGPNSDLLHSTHALNHSPLSSPLEMEGCGERRERDWFGDRSGSLKGTENRWA